MSNILHIRSLLIFIYTSACMHALTADAVVAGGLAGLSMTLYRSSSIALYLASKLSEVRIKTVFKLNYFLRL